ncbi:MAG TPA: hypothetical protein VMV49_01720 [Candidatus Deferrimicrobium sp.]|nr:hypothetical protein [Candidatus Deferrimicrobium sp.]
MISREELHKERAASLLLAMFYIEIYSEMQKKYDPATVEQKLREMGDNIANGYFAVWQPSATSISGLTREISETIAGIKKYKLKKVVDGFTLTTPECPLCLPEVVIEGPHYCIVTMTILEEMINLAIQASPEKFNYRGVSGRVIRSKSCGGEECEYYYQLIEK